MDNVLILSFLIFFPAFGAVLLLLIQATIGGGATNPQNEARIAFLSGLFISGATFIVSIIALAFYAPSSTDQFQLIEDFHWFGGNLNETGELVGGVRYRLGVDGMSLLLILLSTFLIPICFLASWGRINTRVTEYVAAFLIMESLMIGVFCALDLVLFYVFFEAGLIPMFIIIGIWGGPERVYASFKFFLYTFLGSLFLFLAILYLYLTAGTTQVEGLQNLELGTSVQNWLWLAFFASFAVKLPMWPVHTWLPDAHVQAPTAGSVILAGVLLKMGGYGFLRFSLPLFPDASQFFQPMVFALSVIAILYTSLVAFRQTDMKKLIAYSSVAHMGFVTLGIFSFTETGLQGAIFQMLSHGLISGALFLIVGVVYDRYHKRDIAFYGGLVTRMPVYAAIFLLFTMANVGLPGTSGFVGEILTMTGSFHVSSWAAGGAVLGIIFSAVYMLSLYKRTMFGEIQNDVLLGAKDLNFNEVLMFAPLIGFTILLGVFPSLVMDITESSVLSILSLSSTG